VPTDPHSDPQKKPSASSEGMSSDSKRTHQRSNALRITALAMQIPFMVFAGYLIGSYLDDRFETTYLRPLLSILAVIAAFVQLIHEVLKNARED